MMKLTLDQVFPRRHWRNTSGASDSEGRKVEWTHPVKNHADGENMWEFLCQIGLVRSVPRMRTKANATELAAEEDNTKGEAESIK
ncbi:MAG: hypothetical protein P4M11_14065 [Candidatus Pacebacteria bacterium]|nr:hypothetical protein [Candidatus Paceibacterota bacterium]